MPLNSDNQEDTVRPNWQMLTGIFTFRLSMISSLVVAVCLLLIPVSHCEQLLFCNTAVCPSLSCKDKSCKQICVGPDAGCDTMTCSAKESCTQSCLNCTLKLICSSDTCKQVCSGKNCDMECTKGVKRCHQTCGPDSKCKLSCLPPTACKRACDDSKSNCTYLGTEQTRPPIRKYSCDEKSCVMSCNGSSCHDETLNCSGVSHCDMSCQGCRMICDDTVETCSQECLGDHPCKITCKAQSKCSFEGLVHKCSIDGNVCSAATCVKLGQTLFALIFGLLITHFMNV